MKNIFRNFFSSLPPGARLLVLAYALGFAAWIAAFAHLFNLYDWLALSPAPVWKGQVWRVVTYAFLPGGVVDWVVSLFWLATLVSILGRHWSARELWGYCLLAAVAGALPIVLLNLKVALIGSSAMIFALLAAWYRIYGNERLILMGIGEVSVRQAAILVAIIDALIIYFSCGGWMVLPAMLCGGLAGWLYLSLRGKILMGRNSQPMDSERIARLEL